jgi:hypothetical protein
MNGTYNKAERRWVGLVKEQPCSVCGEAGPSDAHHIEQGLHYTCVALCKSCHQGSLMGWHGQKRAWAIAKMEEIDALNVTISNIFTNLISSR